MGKKLANHTAEYPQTVYKHVSTQERVLLIFLFRLFIQLIRLLVGPLREI